MSSQITPQQFEKLSQLYINKVNQIFSSYKSSISLNLGEDLGVKLTQNIVDQLTNNLDSLINKGEISQEESQNLSQQLSSDTIFENIYALIFKQACNYLANQLPPEKGVAFLAELQDEDAFEKFLQLFFEYFEDGKDNVILVKAFVDGYKKEVDSKNLISDPIVNILSH